MKIRSFRKDGNERFTLWKYYAVGEDGITLAKKPFAKGKRPFTGIILPMIESGRCIKEDPLTERFT